MGLTFGDSAAPSQLVKNFDALFTQSLANYEKKLVDQIGSENPFFHKMLRSGYYQGTDGGTDPEFNLMYELGQMDTYSGYDELSADVIDGVTRAIWQWRQAAVPIQYSMKELIQNRRRLVDMVETKMMQMEMEFQEGWSTHFFQGSGDGALETPRVSTSNGSVSFDPLPKLVQFDPTTSEDVGNINQSTYSWWRNETKTSAATTYDDLLFEMVNFYNTLGLKIGGSPDLIITDQVTYELITRALYQRYRQTGADNSFPFENTKWKKAVIVMDEKVPDVYSNLTSTSTYGTIYMLNTKFMRIKYINGRNFQMLTDENGKRFAKPLRGDSRLGHSAWMGAVGVNNRRKQGVMGKIPRTLT